MALVIDKQQIKDWLAELKKDYQVKDMRRTFMSAKQYFFPPKEEVFVFNKKGGQLVNPERVKKKRLLVFGLQLDDLEAMTQLDEIMSKPQSDFFYWQRREGAVLVGLTDESIGVAPGGDMILEKINPNQYRVLILTKQDEKLTQSKFIKEIKSPQIKQYPTEKTPLKEMLLDSELLADAVAWSWQGQPKIWQKLGRQCLGCGNCTYVCPLCYCFSMEDKVGLDGETCSRCRKWDACTLPRFAQITGGHNFHQSVKERYYNWFYHKFVRAYKEYGRSQCVGCGRCAAFCPAGINIEKVLLEILAAYKKSHNKEQSRV